MPLIKPAPWAVGRAHVEAQYQDLWSDLAVALPVWEASGLALGNFGGHSSQGSVDSGLDWVVSRVGPAIQWNAGNTAVDTGIEAPTDTFITLESTQLWTFGVVFLWDGTTGDERALISQFDSVGSVPSFRLRVVNAASPGSIEFAGGGNAWWSGNTGTSSLVANEWHVFLMSSTGAWRLLNLETSAKFSGTFSVVNTPSGKTTSPIKVGKQLANDPYRGEVAGVYVWEREFSTVELDRAVSVFERDPFALTRPAVTDAGAIPTTPLFATGDGTIQDVVNENDQGGV